jgi:hypothetical protein
MLLYVNFMSQYGKVNKVTNCQVDNRDSLPSRGWNLFIYRYVQMGTGASTHTEVPTILVTSGVSLAIQINNISYEF